MTEIHQAIPFTHQASLVAFVRQYGRPQKQGEYRLYDAVRARTKERMLFLVRTDRSLPVNAAYKTVEVSLSQSARGLRLESRGRCRGVYHVNSARSADRLPALVGLKKGEVPSSVGTVVFWLRDEQLFQLLVTLSMRLGCDRLQASALDEKQVRGWGREGDAEVGSGRVLLLRAERPSYFVIDKALKTSGVEVFVPSSSQLYLPWGMAHPLEDKWYHEGEGALFMRGQGQETIMSHVVLPRWGDIYGLTRFTLEGMTLDEAWGEGARPLRRFEIKMQLVRAHKQRETHLWMLPGGEHERLERLLHMVPERDLDALMFSVQSSPEGEEYVLIRERHTGQGRQYIDFDGKMFAPYAGYPNLMLPVTHDLEPPLRKDRYRDLFELVMGRLTLLWEEGSELKVVQVDEKSFRPLTEYVDYIISGGRASLEAILNKSVFDFQRFEMVPRRPSDYGIGPRGASQAREAQDEVEGLEQFDEVQLEPGDASSAAPGEVPVEALTLPKPKEEAPDALRLEEARLEEEIIQLGQSVARWRDLGEVKVKLNEMTAAAACWTEALWLSFVEEAAEEALMANLVDALEKQPNVALALATEVQRQQRVRQQALMEDSEPHWLWLHIIYGARRASHQDRGALREWLTESYKLLHQRERSLRTKAQWLLWRQLIKVNQDSIQEVKVREKLLEGLTERGLQSFEAPGFIRDRIYRSRFLALNDGEGSGELEAATVILDSMQRELEKAHDPALARVSLALMAYGYERLGNRGQSEHCSQRAEEHLESPIGLTVVDQAWMALYLGATADLKVAGSGQAWVDRYNKLLGRYSDSGLAVSELKVLQNGMFSRVEADNPAAFFAPSRFRSFHDSSKYVDAKRIKDRLSRHLEKGRFEVARRELSTLATQAESGQLRLKIRPFAWLLGEIVSTLRRLGQATEGIELLRKIEGAQEKIEGFGRLRLYADLFRLKLAEGYLALGEEQHGVQIITDVVQSCREEKALAWLDHLDMLGAALNAIELVPVQSRIEAVNEVMRALFIVEKHRQDDKPDYRAIKLRLLDHCVEVALSKEKLSLRHYKNYLEEDEFHVRFRVVKEQLT